MLYVNYATKAVLASSVGRSLAYIEGGPAGDARVADGTVTVSNPNWPAGTTAQVTLIRGKISAVA